MKPIDVFSHSKKRSEHFLNLYDLLHDKRRRRTRSDWADNFKRLMHWPKRKQIHRVDGKNSVLIIREGMGIDARHFAEHYLNELLRAALIGIVAALDRYIHDVVVTRIVATLRRPHQEMSGDLHRLKIPIVVAKAAVKHAHKSSSTVRTRPMNIIKAGLQDMLHKEKVFQKPDDIANGLGLIGIKNLWKSCAGAMHCTPNDIIKRLNKIVDRRNRIVHESDVKRHRRGGHIILHPISRKEVEDDIHWVADLVEQIDNVQQATP